jgi:hypothetical protein
MQDVGINKVACIVGVDDNSTSKRNVILRLKSLVFLVVNLCQRQCREHIDAKEAEKSPLQLKVFGIATGRHMNCSCGASASLRPNVVPDAGES